jgi:hypothetical protein
VHFKMSGSGLDDSNCTGIKGYSNSHLQARNLMLEVNCKQVDGIDFDTNSSSGSVTLEESQLMLNATASASGTLSRGVDAGVNTEVYISDSSIEVMSPYGKLSGLELGSGRSEIANTSIRVKVTDPEGSYGCCFQNTAAIGVEYAGTVSQEARAIDTVIEVAGGYRTQGIVGKNTGVDSTYVLEKVWVESAEGQESMGYTDALSFSNCSSYVRVINSDLNGGTGAAVDYSCTGTMDIEYSRLKGVSGALKADRGLTNVVYSRLDGPVWTQCYNSEGQNSCRKCVGAYDHALDPFGTNCQ